MATDEACHILTFINFMLRRTKRARRAETPCVPRDGADLQSSKRRKMMRNIIIGLCMFASPVAFAGGAALSGNDLHAMVAGKTVYVQSPLGEIPIKYGANGTLSGRTQLALLDGEETTADHGRWWVSGDRLCMKWNNWMQGQTYCFAMHKMGRSLVRWQRNDGKTGTARIS
jgi:hypothetical protein